MKIKYINLFFLIIFTFLIKNCFAQNNNFQCIVLGCYENVENNLPSFAFSNLKNNDFFCIDAGTLLPGINAAIKQKIFRKFKFLNETKTSKEMFFLRNNIKAFLISNENPESYFGLSVNISNDLVPVVYGFPHIIESVKFYINNNKSSVNSDMDLQEKKFEKIKYISIQPNEEIGIKGTEFFAYPYLIKNSKNKNSSAYLIKFNDTYFLYLGNIIPDINGNSNELDNVWNKIAPLIKENKLNAIFIGCPVSNENAGKEFPKLHPSLLIKELEQLARKIDKKEDENSLKGLKVIITHIKSSFNDAISDEGIIKYQLRTNNKIGVNFNVL